MTFEWLNDMVHFWGTELHCPWWMSELLEQNLIITVIKVSAIFKFCNDTNKATQHSDSSFFDAKHLHKIWTGLPLAGATNADGVSYNQQLSHK